MSTVPLTSGRTSGAMVCSADRLAAEAGVGALASGGNAVDAAIAASAAIAVTCPHLCGLGGDLFALVHLPSADRPAVLNASGRAGGGASSAALRSEGKAAVPLRHDVRSVTIPGCVDGWLALHQRYGKLGLDALLAPAVRLAEEGFPAAPSLVQSLADLDGRGREALGELAAQAHRPGACVRRPGLARALQAIGARGRAGFYTGAFGEGLLELGQGWFHPADLERPQADWVAPLGVEVWGRRLWTVPPNSQGYLALAAGRIAEALGLPADPAEARWAHLLVEASIAAGFDRPAVLAEGVDGEALVAEARLAPRRAAIRDSAGPWTAPALAGDTTYLCAVDRDRMAVSLIQSNAAGFGSWLVEPRTGINLHNRGLGFSLEPGHPAELAPGARPPHTLSPLLATRGDGALAAVLGTMGGDSQPQILLQVAARLFAHGQSPGEAIGAGRWVLSGPSTGFDTWTGSQRTVVVEGHAPSGWAPGLEARGHQVRRIGPWEARRVGHAHAIVLEDGGELAGAADPRAQISACAWS